MLGPSHVRGVSHTNRLSNSGPLTDMDGSNQIIIGIVKKGRERLSLLLKVSQDVKQDDVDAEKVRVHD